MVPRGCVSAEISVLGAELSTIRALSEKESGKMHAAMLRQPLAHHPPAYVRPLEVVALVVARQSQVVEAEQVQEHGVEVVDVHGVLRHVPADLFCRVVDDDAA